MDLTTVTVGIISIIVAKSFALLGLWMLLRWRVRREQIRCEHLTSAVEAVATGGQLEFDEQQGGLRLKITCPPTGRKHQAA
ncbi:hypothetical protein [Streptomyces sp. NPDC048637]|uniref:hypothetical protein n=1 Tax=Streptomyces sp. NPDC048637 TaxID=3155636 RepID=UPI003418C2C2